MCTLRDTLQVSLNRHCRIVDMKKNGTGWNAGLRENMTLRWVGNNEVMTDREAEDSWDCVITPPRHLPNTQDVWRLVRRVQPPHRW